MKQILLPLFLMLAVVGCSQKDTSNILEPTSQIEISGKTYTFNDMLLANENCNELFMTVIPTPTNHFSYVLEISLSKKGDIIKVDFADGKLNYQSPIFNSKDFFNITSFQFDPLTNLLSFDFDGDLFGPNTTQSINIKGSIKRVQVKPVACAGALSSLEANLNLAGGEEQRYYCAIASSVRDDVSFQQYFYSNDGYRIVFENESGLWNLPNGTYTANSGSSTPFKIRFDKYLGSSEKSNSNLFIDKEWQSYKVAGTVQITDHIIQTNGWKQTVGKLSFTAYTNDNKTAYVLKNGDFSVVGTR